GALAQDELVGTRFCRLRPCHESPFGVARTGRRGGRGVILLLWRRTGRNARAVPASVSADGPGWVRGLAPAACQPRALDEPTARGYPAPTTPGGSAMRPDAVRVRPLLVLLAVLAAPALARAADLDPAKLALIKPRFQRYVDDGQIAGAVTVVGTSKGVD